MRSICTGACLEQAIPPKLFPQRLRIAVYGFVFAIFAWNFVDAKLWRTCGQDCPKLVVEGYVELSALDISSKSFFIAAMLALHGGYRAYRYSLGACIYDSGLYSRSPPHTGPLSTHTGPLDKAKVLHAGFQSRLFCSKPGYCSASCMRSSHS